MSKKGLFTSRRCVNCYRADAQILEAHKEAAKEGCVRLRWRCSNPGCAAVSEEVVLEAVVDPSPIIHT
jgi:hypothetical protein